MNVTYSTGQMSLYGVTLKELRDFLELTKDLDANSKISVGYSKAYDQRETGYWTLSVQGKV